MSELRFLAVDPGSVWIVEQGFLDVFAVELREGEAIGPRLFLWTTQAGDALFGIVPVERDRRFGLLAVGRGATQVQPVTLTGIRELARQPEGAAGVTRLAEGFISAASAAIGRAFDPYPRQDIVAGRSVALADGGAAGSPGGVIWVRSEKGSVRFAGITGAGVSAEAGVIAIAGGAWLTANGGPARVAAFDAPTDWWRHDEAWDGLARFQALFARWIAERALAVEARERTRLGLKAEADRHMREQALAALASTLGHRRPAAAAPPTANPLVAACRAVGAVAGIEFRSPPAWEVERQVRDPLRSICRASRVRHRRVALRDRWWRADGAPLLAYAGEERRPVALLPEGRRYQLFDPASGQRVPVDASVSGTLDPFAFEFYRPSPDTAIKPVDLARMVFAEMRADLARLLLAAFASGLLGLVMPIATGQVFKEIIPMAVPGNLVWLLAALSGITLATALFDLTRALALVRIQGRTNATLQALIIDRLLALPVPFFRAFSIGDLAVRAGAINAARDLLGGAAITTLLTGVFSLVNLLLLCYYSWYLALVAMGILLVAVLFTGSFAIATIRLERRQQAVAGRLSGLVFQILGGIAKLRVAGAEGRAFAIWADRFRDQRVLAMRGGLYATFVAVFNQVLPVLSTLTLFATASYLMKQDKTFNTGDYVAFSAAFGSFFASGISLSTTLVGLLKIVPMLERAQPILEARLETGAAKPDPGELAGRIEVSHVSFRYAPGGPQILEDVSLAAPPGAFVALVGPSGSGKSTLLRLLLGFEPPESGAIYYDGQDLGVVDLTAVRAQIGVVLQSSRLLAGDILLNIIGSSPLTIRDAWQAAEMAGLANDIREMPMGMQTVVSEGGTTLSGGQRQRLLIARALVRRPRIILFDEATSALDNQTQEIVSRSLEKMKATRIVIAHRLSTVRNADRIYVLDAGRIVQQGSYEELSQQPGLFSQLIARQLA